ncbi:hypothetical protein M408DRAFT_328446 [Serendipita vermifera MAFF 305830]|uniref:Uncharacterized protein n=1 Tax=Serendipita vermifera MAFF 305830 TaxID=933852 RepID=A0A0C3BEZ1_SERVB|nr:hypothetical protein M408DRAFT_328446 [Serendipita vermifera MAFF 305830]
MSGLENDDYIPDEGHLVSGKVRRSRHIEAGGPGGRPGQRGKNKREHGEKPVVSVKWNQQLTEQLWTLIKTKPELKRVLVNEPTRFLGPHGAAGSLFSKKDLQKTIAEQLFNDGTYDLNDQMIMENLTRAVKNKLHKTQMLYESSHRELPPEFPEYQSELEIHPAHRAKWAKVKDRFPTYFEYHELAQEIPAITKDMEHQAQQFGAWKAKALSGSEEGSPNSFISNNRQRSRSIDTSASWDVPDSPPLMNLHSGGDQEFEVLPPPADNRATFSDMESFGGHASASALSGISPGVSPSMGTMPLQRSNSFHMDPSNRWSPNQGPSMIPLGSSGMGASMSNGARATNDGISPVWAPSVPSQLNLETQSYNPNGVSSAAPWSGAPSPLSGGPTGPRYPPGPNSFGSNQPPNGLHLSAQNMAQPNSSDATTRKHRRGASNGNTIEEAMLRSVSPQATSPFSPDYSSASGSPDMPGSGDSPRDDREIETLVQILRDRERRKKQRDEELLRLKYKKIEDRERQRLENQRQREENEKRRQHEAAMMERKIQMLQLEAQLRQQQSESVSGGTAGSNMASPVNFANGAPMGMNEGQYPDSLNLFQQVPSNQLSQYDQHSLAMMSMASRSHPVSPLHMNQPLQQPSQQQRMGMLDSSLPSSFHQEGYNDAQLEDMFGTGI